MRKIICGLLFSCLITTSGIAYSSWYYGPTFENERLYRIARRVRPNPSISVQQMMMALLYANPSAFNHHNINGLKSGYQLRIPPFPAVARINPITANNLVNLQNREWLSSHSDTKIVKLVKKSTKHSHARHQIDEDLKDSIPSIQMAKAESIKIAKKLPDHAKSSLVEVASNGKTNLNSSLTDSADNKSSTNISDSNADTNNASTNAASVNNTGIEQVKDFADESKKFQQETSTQIASLQQQTKVLQTTVVQLNKDLQALSYQFIQLAATTTRKNSAPINSEDLLNGIKQNALGLGAGILALIVLTYLLTRTFRKKPIPISKKDEYDYMGSSEGIPSKLDLASAYIDMGDYSAAESALKEVIAKGSEDQKRAARELLGNMNQR